MKRRGFFKSILGSFVGIGVLKNLDFDLKDKHPLYFRPINPLDHIETRKSLADYNVGMRIPFESIQDDRYKIPPFKYKGV